MSFVAVGIALVGGATSAIMANKARKDAKSRQRKAEDKIAALERTRQKVEDPYKDVQDLSGMLTNPYANLQVATKAAELQGEEADISLASTLDTMRASGAGAGGATALAQAALRSKLGISANIEQQEAQNARMRAQGQAQMNQMRMAEAQRIQQAGIAGKQFVFGAQEQREMAQLNRAAGFQQQAMSDASAYQGQMIGAIGGAFGSAAGAYAGMQGGS
tara:strand:+ start:2699 stop:3352 length:654 start_codon:yes stop_codon:yes gene_type:complete